MQMKEAQYELAIAEKCSAMGGIFILDIQFG